MGRGDRLALGRSSSGSIASLLGAGVNWELEGGASILDCRLPLFFRGERRVGSAVADDAVLWVLLKKPWSVFWLFSPVEPIFFSVGVCPEGVEATPVFFLDMVTREAGCTQSLICSRCSQVSITNASIRKDATRPPRKALRAGQGRPRGIAAIELRNIARLCYVWNRHPALIMLPSGICSAPLAISQSYAYLGIFECTPSRPHQSQRQQTI
jgi:hypothetical protein